MTPNGVFKTNTQNLCISISRYHPESWRPAIGLHGFADQLIGCMIAYDMLGSGIGLIFNDTTKEQKQVIANSSKAFNETHYSEILNTINESYDKYAKNWK